MSERNESATKASEAARTPHEPAGIMLKRERERQGLSLDEVAVQLNLRPTVVAGIEEDRFEQVPIAAYRRGYVRAYARLLGMDENAVVSAYDATYGRADIERKLTPVHTTRAPSRIGAWIFRLFTLLVIIGLIALTLLWWQSREGNDIFGSGGDEGPAAVDSIADSGGSSGGTTMTPNSDTALPPVSTPENTPPVDDDSSAAVDTASDAANSAGVAATAETSTPDVDERQAEQVAASADAAAVADSDDTTADTSGTTADTAAAPATADDTLSLTFNEESWTEIYDANDNRIFSGLQSAGSQATAEGTPPFRLTIGNASGVSLEYRGQPVDLGQYTGGNNVARFTLGD